MCDVYTVEDLEKAKKKAQRREWVKNKVNAATCWFYNNKEMIIILGPVVVGAIGTGVKVLSRNVSMKKEKDLKDLYCYDRSLGHYWTLRRKLTNAEWVEIDKRKNNGERLADILSELKVLK